MALLSACSDYDPGMSDSVVDYTDTELQILSEYDANFIAAYGTPAAGHTWGFGEMKVWEGGNTTRTVNVNRNQWVVRVDDVKRDENGETVKDASGNDMREITWKINTDMFPNGVIPGFPSIVDGRYYTEEGDFGSLEEIEAEGLTAVHPVGDVCQEEILQVSQWFRTHRYPTSLEPDFNAIFFQEISQDVDRKIVGTSQEEIEANYDEGVWDATFDTPDDNEYKGTANYGMDYLTVKGAGYADIDYYTKWGDGWEHINNYNNYSEDVYTDTDGTVHHVGNHIDEDEPNSDDQELLVRKIKYWTSDDGSKAIDFGYHGSYDDNVHNTWVICKVPYVVNGKKFEGTYLAFDYEMDKTGKGGGTIVCDGFYSNWIIKLSEGTFIENVDPDPDPEPEPEPDPEYWARVMCEDLGNTHDFDFNDLVFDVYFTENEAGSEYAYTAHVRVQAAGGTLPIYLHYDGNEAYEAHKILKSNTTSIPVNVDAHPGKTLAPVDVTIQTNSNDANDIDIYVGKKAAEGVRKTTLLPKAGKGTSITPQKICIPGNTARWMKESKLIETSYTHFADWVTTPTGPFGFDGATPWITTDVDTTNLY